MNLGVVIGISAGSAVAIGVGLWLTSRRRSQPVTATHQDWKSDAITPAGAEPRGRVVERVARQGVLTQGIVVACEMAHADGEIAPVEVETLRAFIVQHVPDGDERYASTLLEDGLRQRIAPDALDNAIETIRAVGSEAQRRLIIELLITVAQADGTVHPEEAAYMEMVGERLGLGAEDVQGLLELP